MISEDSASPFFAFSCGLAGVLLTHHPLRPERWNVGRPRKPGAAFWVCFLVVLTSPAILKGVVFSGVNLMALNFSHTLTNSTQHLPIVITNNYN